MCRRNKGQSRRRRLICSRRRACSEEFKLTMIGEGTAVSGATLGGFALSGVAKEVCRGPYQFLPSVRPMPWFDLAGSLVTQRGYHVSTRAYFHLPPTLQNLVVPEMVTRRDLQEAIEALEDLFCDFPFVDESSKAHAFAALLTGVVRNLVLGGVPMYVISA